jgi:uncharacterized protein (UPF0335 family)
MARRKTVNKIEHLDPNELQTLDTDVQEFIKRLNTIENEMTVLREDRKELMEEFSEKIDVKTLQAAMKIAKIKAQVAHKDAFDHFLEVLDGPSSD